MKNLIIRIAISVLAISAMIGHLTKIVEFGWESLVLLAIAFLPWLSEFIDTFKLGKDSLEFKMREIEKKSDAALDASLRGVAKNPSAKKSTTKALKVSHSEDPQKGKWGGSPTNNGRLLSAQIEKIPGENFYRRVNLRVESTDPTKPLSGVVTFHLHDTFDTPDFDEQVINGVAETKIISYGVFTVGAETDNRQTKLELDLASLDDHKDNFFKR